MAKAIKPEDRIIWQCKEYEKLLYGIGKELRDLSADEWDIVFSHVFQCQICQLNHQVAAKIIEEELPDVLASLEGESLNFKGQ